MKEDNKYFYFFNESAMDLDPELVKNKTTIISEDQKINLAGIKVKTITFDTVLQSTGVMNWNGKKYIKPWLKESIENNPIIQNDLSHDQWMGEYGHPLGEGLSPNEKGMRQSMIQPDRTSHRINKVWWEDNLLMGRITTLPSGYGINLRDNTLAGVIPSFSYRGMGTVNPKTKEVNRGLITVTYDYVFRPSHKEAYGTKLISLNESALLNNMQQDATEKINLSEAVSFINDAMKNKSTEFKKISELFEAASVNGYLDASLGAYYIQHEGTTILVPIEKSIRKNIKNILLP